MTKQTKEFPPSKGGAQRAGGSDVQIEKLGNARVLHTSAGVFAVSDSPYDTFDSLISNPSKVDWEKDATIVMGKKVVPYGENNNLPDVIRDIMDDNNLAPGILQREKGLLYGDGPRLYKEEYSPISGGNAEGKGGSGEIRRVWLEDKEVNDWLNSWNYKRFIDMAMVEYKYMDGVFAKRYLNRGSRIGHKPYIKNLEVVPSTDARLAWPETGAKRLENVKHIYTGDFSNNCYQTGIATYPVYDPFNPFAHKVSIAYHNKYSFARQFYSVPSYYGSLKWIKRSSDIPDVLAHLGENGITSAYHIHSPAKYWEDKREKLEKKYPEETDAQIDTRLDDIKDEFFKKLAKVLTGKKNAGKFIDTVDFHDEDGNLCEWKIESLDQQIKDFITSQIKISEKADSATTSGMGLHPSLSNIIVNGQLSSGSQMLYALKLYLASDTTIPEEVIFEPINQAIQANWPGKNIKLGFYRRVVMKEEQVDPEERVAKKADKS